MLCQQTCTNRIKSSRYLRCPMSRYMLVRMDVLYLERVCGRRLLYQMQVIQICCGRQRSRNEDTDQNTRKCSSVYSSDTKHSTPLHDGRDNQTDDMAQMWEENIILCRWEADNDTPSRWFSMEAHR